LSAGSAFDLRRLNRSRLRRLEEHHERPFGLPLQPELPPNRRIDTLGLNETRSTGSSYVDFPAAETNFITRNSSYTGNLISIATDANSSPFLRSKIL
jgi:hypothetical protein